MDRAHNFLFLLDEGFTMQAFSSAVEVLRLLARVIQEPAPGYGAVSFSGGPVRASNGFQLVPDTRLDSIPRDATIVVVAGAGASRTNAPGLTGLVRRLARGGHPVWGVSSGVVRLAEAGLLSGRRVAAHWEDVPYLHEHFPDIQVSPSLFEIDGAIATCAGGQAASDLMLWVVGKSHGTEIAEEIAARLVIDVVRDGRASQRRMLDMRYQTVNPTVFASLRMMRANLFEPVPIAWIAESQRVSQRQLERLFDQEFGQPPSRVYARLRLENAREEVIAGHRPLTEIALDYGFTPDTFARVYKRVFGHAPSLDRPRSRR
ncbi:GlxA family transcriptional regulator [Lutimaribacter marinistellae]|uniref:GlxA family transcriptional regulator n=1 Tax=Lutimaribacter marinistellae TaxID=1820329 RepID=A0ABV7TKS7_9RHOB